MSFFIDILQRIFGGNPIDQRNGQDLEEAIRRNRNTHSHSHSHSQRSQSAAQIHRNNDSNSFISPQSSITPSTVHTSRGSGNIDSPSNVSQSRASNPVITKPNEQALPHNSSLFPSQPSSSSSNPSSSLSETFCHTIHLDSNSSMFPQSSITPTVHTSRGSGNINSPSNVSQSNASNPVITIPSEQALPHNSSLFPSRPSSSSSNPSSSLSEPSVYSSQQFSFFSVSGQHPSILEPTPPSTSSSSGTPSTRPTLSPASPNQNDQQRKTNYAWVEKGASPSTSTKPTVRLDSSNLNNQQDKTNYIWVDKGASPIYVIPDDFKGVIEKDIVPGVLKKPLSASTYKDYFEALLYAEDYYHEKWNGFEIENVTLELHKAAIYTKKGKGKDKDLNKFDEKDDKIFVKFEIDSIPQKLPFLLSRDFASVRPTGSRVEHFQGIIYRVVKSNIVLVEFGEDFHSQHDSACKYDVKFSFNRVCLKRAHQAIAAASDPLFQNFLFPDGPRNTPSAFQALPINHELDREQVSAVQQILSLNAAPPYLVEGSLAVAKSGQLSRTGMVVQQAVFQIYKTSPSCRILICAPINRTCDVLMRGLKKEIPETKMFRANAAFRELDGVPIDILPSCHYKGECFSCPSRQQLRKFKVVLSTFVSSFRLHSEGIVAGHFSHIFLVDASSATEPETMVALANLANEKTAVLVTGAARMNHSRWIRSDIARKNGLMTSYFDRLCENKLYKSLDPKFTTRL